MQHLPRVDLYGGSLSEAEVVELLLSPTIEVDFGAWILNDSLSPVEDISADVLDGTVEWGLHDRYHRGCSITLQRKLAWGPSLLVRPHIDIRDVQSLNGARFYPGTFVLTTADPGTLADLPQTFVAKGFDRVFLLDRPVGDTYVASGDVVAAMEKVIADAGFTGVQIDASASGTVLEQPMVWPIISEGEESGPTTWLRVFNDLAKTVNYRGVWCDEYGVFRTGPYRAPIDRGAEFEFESVALGEEITEVVDYHKLPNGWKFLRRNMPTDDTGPLPQYEGRGQYTVANTSGDLDWIEVVELDAANQQELVKQGNALVASSRRGATKIKAETGPWPVAGHADVYVVNEETVGVRKVQAVEWRQSLDGGNTEWVWEEA